MGAARLPYFRSWMSYQTVRSKHVLIAVWKNPELSDGPLIVHDAKRAFAEVGQPILFISVAPMNSPPPPEDLRKYMGEHVDEMLEYCSDLHIVIEGTGFMNSAKRLAMASIVLVSGRRKRMFVHEGMVAVRAALKPTDRDALLMAIRRAETDGILKPAAATSQA